MRNPFLRNTSSLLIYSGIWSIISIAQMLLLIFIAHQNYTYAIMDVLFSNFIFASCILSYWYYVKFISLEHMRWYVVLGNHLIAGAIFLSIWFSIQYYFVVLIISAESYLNFTINNSINRLITGSYLYLLIILIYYFLIYYQSFKSKLYTEAELYRTLSDTKLLVLKSQLQPHFIFNCLHSINSLIVTDAPKAQEMLINLSDFLRNTLTNQDNAFVKIEDELEFARLYIAIEKIRFGTHLKLNEYIDNDLLDLKIPHLLLQPLIENAIKYSATNKDINISISKDNQNLKIKITNTFEQDAVCNKGTGIGLKNVQKRLQLLYSRNNLIST